MPYRDLKEAATHSHMHTFTSLRTHDTLKSTPAHVFPRHKEHGTVSKMNILTSHEVTFQGKIATLAFPPHKFIFLRNESP